MAVPGADRRKSIETRRIGSTDSALSRSIPGGSSPVSDPDGSAWPGGLNTTRGAVFADTPGKREAQVPNGIVETDGGFAFEPPAIEAVTERFTVAEQSDRISNRDVSDDRFDENGIYPHYLKSDSSARCVVVFE